MNTQSQIQALEKSGEKTQDGKVSQDLIRLKKF
jgi:hypothetical protein